MKFSLVVGLQLCFFVQVSTAMQLIATFVEVMSGLYDGITTSYISGKSAAHNMECRKKLLYVCDLINAGSYTQALAIIEEIYDDSYYWDSNYYTQFLLQAAVHAENLVLLRKMANNSLLCDSSLIDCLSYAMAQKSLPAVKLICLHLYSRCCRRRPDGTVAWDAELFNELQTGEYQEDTTDEIRTYLATFWNSVDAENPEPRLEKMYTHRSLEHRCARGLIDGLVKGTNASFPDEFGETLLQKAIRLGYRDSEQMIVLFTKFRGTLFGLIQQIRAFNGSERLIAIDRKKLNLVRMLLRDCPVFLDSSFRDKNGDTVLHAAIKQSQDDLVKYIVFLDASNRYGKYSLLNCKNKQGDTPLALAVGLGRFELVACFLGCPYLKKDEHAPRALISAQSVAS